METSGKIAAHATFNGVASQFRSATTEVRGMLGTGDSNVEQIDFTNYNYPPFLNVIHYKLDELLPVKQPIVKRLNWLFLLTVLYTIINFINVLIMLVCFFFFILYFSLVVVSGHICFYLS